MDWRGIISAAWWCFLDIFQMIGEDKWACSPKPIRQHQGTIWVVGHIVCLWLDPQSRHSASNSCHGKRLPGGHRKHLKDVLNLSQIPVDSWEPGKEGMAAERCTGSCMWNFIYFSTSHSWCLAGAGCWFSGPTSGCSLMPERWADMWAGRLCKSGKVEGEWLCVRLVFLQQMSSHVHLSARAVGCCQEQEPRLTLLPYSRKSNANFSTLSKQRGDWTWYCLVSMALYRVLQVTWQLSIKGSFWPITTFLYMCGWLLVLGWQSLWMESPWINVCYLGMALFTFVFFDSWIVHNEIKHLQLDLLSIANIRFCELNEVWRWAVNFELKEIDCLFCSHLVLEVMRLNQKQKLSKTLLNTSRCCVAQKPDKLTFKNESSPFVKETCFFSN